MWEDLLDQLSVDDMINMVNLGGFQTVGVDSIGKVGTQDSDGTSGLNDWYIGVYGTAYPTELLSAFTGRNFEYYSEDGVLGGMIALNTINGLSTKGVYPYIKHFVMNDQETNRCTMLLTYSDEQAIREIYLKPFEICVKNFEGQSLAVMSSFNFVGDRWTGANPNLLNNVLRDEWGFRGMVLTDWNGSYGYQNTDDAVRNGNDAMLGFASKESNKITNTSSATLVKAMRQACKNILYTTVNSGNYTVPDPDAGKMSNMTKLFLEIDITSGVVLVAVMAIVLVRFFKKRKKNVAEEA